MGADGFVLGVLDVDASTFIGAYAAYLKRSG